MYPFNKIAQFDKQVMTEIGGPVGSMILIRATERPKMLDIDQIAQRYRQNINKQRSNAYYMAGPQKVREINRRNILDIDVEGGGEFDPGDILFGGRDGLSNVWLIVLVAIIVLGAFWWMSRQR
jgi:hypothetical protein